MSVTDRAEQFEPLPPELDERWRRYPNATGGPYFPQVLGLEMVDVRAGWCSLRLPFRPELRQAGGVVHGGVLASLLDTVLVPAVGGVYPDRRAFSTLDLTVQYLGAVVEQDLVAEGWVTRRGRSVVFCQAEARVEGTDEPVALGTATYKVASPPPA